MKDPGCDTRSGQLAMDALGRLEEAERAELATHLATCEACRATKAELTATVGALDSWAAGTTPVPAAVVPPDLSRAILADLGSSAAAIGSGRRIRKVALACGSIAAVAVAAVLVTAGTNRSDLPKRTISLQGARGVTATAVLVERPWGTALTVREQGLPPGQTYTVSMANRQGHWWTAGSYRTAGSAPVEATMACAAQFHSIDEVRVSDSSGRAVLTNDPKTTYGDRSASR